MIQSWKRQVGIGLALLIGLVLATATYAQDELQITDIFPTEGTPGSVVTLTTNWGGLFCSLTSAFGESYFLGITDSETQSLNFVVPEDLSTDQFTTIQCNTGGELVSFTQEVSLYITADASAIIDLSPDQGAPGSEITLTAAGREGISCVLYQFVGEFTVNFELGRANNDGVLVFTVPAGLDAGDNYAIACEYRDIELGTYGFTGYVSFVVLPIQITLSQGPDYFSGKQLAYQSVGPFTTSNLSSSNQRFQIVINVTNPQGEQLVLTATSGNAGELLAYANNLRIFFDVIAAPVAFVLNGDQVPLPAGCPLPPAMIIGARGRVLPDPPLNNIVRAEPGLNGARRGSISPNGEFTVIGGPECVDQINWWLVQTDSGLEGWTAEGNSRQYYAETYADIDVEIAVAGNFPNTHTAIVYYAIDPEIARNRTHRYRSTARYSAQSQVIASGGQVALVMARNPPLGGYRDSASSSAGSPSRWLQHNSAPQSASYLAVVTGTQNLSQYTLYGTFVISSCC